MPMGIKEALEKVESFRGLKRNWDSYDGLPPSQAAIEKAKTLLSGLFVCPLCDGTISITLGGEEITLIVNQEGDVLAYLT